MEVYRTVAFGFVMACWMAFALIFLLRKRQPSGKAEKSAPASRFGIILQACAYALVWSIRRHYTLPVFPLPVPGEMALLVFVCLMAAGSIWMTMAAVRTLGKQWSVTARVFEGHELITTGPYRVVRNPIYTGMFGMLIATSLVAARWQVIVPAGVLFLIGTLIRIRSEEKILRDAFGQQYDDYAKRVSAIIPGVF